MAKAVAIDESSNGKARGIQLVQIEGFLEVARRGSVSRAAEALFVTQPTLTARLHGLERELGTIEKGRLADLVVVNGNPLDDVTMLRDPMRIELVLKDGANPSAQDLRKHVRSQLADFKVPRSIEFRESLPKGGTGKILKAELREPFWEGREKRVN